jgi:hypothetical protein
LLRIIVCGPGPTELSYHGAFCHPFDQKQAFSEEC